MPSKSATGVLHDMARQIRLAQSFVEGSSFEGFQADRRTVYAVIRCLEIISEASRRLPDELKARHPEIPWAGMAGAGTKFPAAGGGRTVAEETCQSLATPRLLA